MLAKQITEVSASATADKSYSTAVNSVKVKVTKKVTAVKPKCPEGYKKK